MSRTVLPRHASTSAVLGEGLPAATAVFFVSGVYGRLNATYSAARSGTPLANLHLTLLDRMGVPTVERIGDSTGRLEHLSFT